MNKAGWARANRAAESISSLTFAVGKIVGQPIDAARGFVDRARDHRGLRLELLGGAVDSAGETADRLDAARLLRFAGPAELVADVAGELGGLLADGVGGGLRRVSQPGA